MKTQDTQEWLKEVYESTGFFCDFGHLYQVSFSQANNRYYKIVVGKKPTRKGVGFSLRGRINIIPKEYVDGWLADGTAI